MKNKYDVIIIGAGPSGIFCAYELLAKKPEKAIELAVKGMLPKGRLGRQMYTKLRVYAGGAHNHEAQMPEIYEF